MTQQTLREAAEQVQWRNIKKVVRALADLCFGSPNDPRYGHCHVAITTSLTAKDGIDVLALNLEPLTAALAAPDRVAELEPVHAQPCGHPVSLLLHSAETKEPLYCEACDDKSGRRDAEARETELTAANRALRERIEALQAEVAALRAANSTFASNSILPDHLAIVEKSEVAGLKRDAERYRWLRDVNTDGEIIFDYSAPSPGVFVFRVNFDGEPIESDEEMAIRLDAAIDAAMKGQS